MATLQEVRRAHQIKQETLAEEAGVGISVISRWERGIGHIEKESAEKVLQALSKLTGQTWTTDNIEVNMYNIMRDRAPVRRWSEQARKRNSLPATGEE